MMSAGKAHKLRPDLKIGFLLFLFLLALGASPVFAGGIWTSSIPAPAACSVDAVASPFTEVRTDRAALQFSPTGAQSLTLEVRGGVVNVSLPNAIAAPASSITIPMTVSDTTGQGIIATDFRLLFDPAVIVPR